MLWQLVKANLTWKAAAKFYIWAVGMAASLAASRTDLPTWVPAALGLATLIAGWLKGQEAVSKPQLAEAEPRA